MSAVGLGAGSIAILIAALYFGGIQYSVPVVLVAIAGLILAGSGVIAWVSAGWVREAIDRKRLAGKMAWPIRVGSTGRRWVRNGTLEADQSGLTLTVDRRAIQAAWSELSTVELIDGGILKGKSIVLDGPRSGRIELEVLQLNAVMRESENGLQECVAILQKLMSEARGRRVPLQ